MAVGSDPIVAQTRSPSSWRSRNERPSSVSDAGCCMAAWRVADQPSSCLATPATGDAAFAPLAAPLLHIGRVERMIQQRDGGVGPAADHVLTIDAQAPSQCGWPMCEIGRGIRARMPATNDSKVRCAAAGRSAGRFDGSRASAWRHGDARPSSTSRQPRRSRGEAGTAFARGRKRRRRKPQQMRFGISILQLDDQELVGVVEHAEATVGTKLEEKAIVHGAHDLLEPAVEAKADGMQHEGSHRQAIVADRARTI